MEKVKDILVTNMVAIYRMVRDFLSALELVVEDTLEEHKEVEVVLEVPIPPLFRSHLVVVKKVNI